MNDDINEPHTNRLLLVKSAKTSTELIERARWALQKSQTDLLSEEAEHEELFKTALGKFNTMTTLFSHIEKDTLLTIMRRHRNKLDLTI